MKVDRVKWPTKCEVTGPPVHLSALNWSDGCFSVQISIVPEAFIAYLSREEWEKWLVRLSAVTASKKRAAAVVVGELGGLDE